MKNESNVTWEQLGVMCAFLVPWVIWMSKGMIDVQQDLIQIRNEMTEHSARASLPKGEVLSYPMLLPIPDFLKAEKK